MEKSDYKKLLLEKIEKSKLEKKYYDAAITFIEECNKFQLKNMIENRDMFISVVQGKTQ